MKFNSLKASFILILSLFVFSVGASVRAEYVIKEVIQNEKDSPIILAVPKWERVENGFEPKSFKPIPVSQPTSCKVVAGKIVCGTIGAITGGTAAAVVAAAATWPAILFAPNYYCSKAGPAIALGTIGGATAGATLYKGGHKLPKRSKEEAAADARKKAVIAAAEALCKESGSEVAVNKNVTDACDSKLANIEYEEIELSGLELNDKEVLYQGKRLNYKTAKDFFQTSEKTSESYLHALTGKYIRLKSVKCGHETPSKEAEIELKKE